jgi:hypothetical protein
MSDLVTIRCRNCGRAIVEGRWVKDKFSSEAGPEFHPVRWHRRRTVIREPGDPLSDDSSPAATRERSIADHGHEYEYSYEEPSVYPGDDEGREVHGGTAWQPEPEIQCGRCGRWTPLMPRV